MKNFNGISSWIKARVDQAHCVDAAPPPLEKWCPTGDVIRERVRLAQSTTSAALMPDLLSSPVEPGGCCS